MNNLTPIDEFQKEAGKAFGKELIKKIFGFLEQITVPPAKELGGLLEDHVRFFRFKTQIKILEKARKFMEENNLEPQNVPIRVLAPLLDHASWEENENMQDRWASLLTNAASDSKSSDNFITYVEILKQISPQQAKFLDLLYENVTFAMKLQGRISPDYKRASRIKDELSLTDYDFNILVDSLIRLNLVEEAISMNERLLKIEQRRKWYNKDPEYIIKSDSISPIVKKDSNYVSLTHLGIDFVRNCKFPFTKTHGIEAKKIIENSFDEIAKNPTGPAVENYISGIKNIYPFAKEEDIRSSLFTAFRRKLTTLKEIDTLPNIVINQDEKDIIINMTLENLTKINS